MAPPPESHVAMGLAARHATTRAARSDDLRRYLAAAPSEAPHDLRLSVMHITIGDLIREEAVARATTEGLAERRREPPERSFPAP